MEHRWGRRTVVSLPVQLKSLYGYAPGRLIDVSVSGALIETDLRVLPSACIGIETPTHGSMSLPSDEVLACVVRAGYGVIAVEWLDFAPPSIVALLAESDRTCRPTDVRQPGVWGRQRPTAPRSDSSQGVSRR
jgi:hypothetical protein